MQVLARSSPNHPWEWHAATLMGGSLFWHRYCIVVIHLDGRVLRRWIRAHALRFEPYFEPAARADVKKNGFAKRTVALPDEYVGEDLLDTPLWNALIEVTKDCVFPVGLRDGSLVYVQDAKDKPLQAGHLKTLFGSANNKLVEQFYSHTVLVPALGPQNQPDHLPVLPSEIHMEILRMLDSVQRQQCRRVCWMWNRIIQRENSGREIWVSFSHQRLLEGSPRTATVPDEAAWRRSAYLLGRCLWKFRTADVDTIIISRATEQQDDNGVLSDTLRLINLAWRRRPSTGRTLILHQFHWDLDFALHAEMQHVERLVWKNCTFSDPRFGHFSRQPVLNLVGQQDVDEGRQGKGMDVYGALQASLPEVSADEMAQLYQWMEEARERPCGMTPMNKIVGFYMYNDPQGHWARNIAGGMAVILHTHGLAKLTRLTLHALLREMQRARVIARETAPLSQPRPLPKSRCCVT
ncbi:uncharacterized protein LOC129601912 isoform X2 [Paramacrobiotus metropolitanus]|nr:uncharacterized protein LOC129601912 isoform X2 [Paramacrobiotus metropolitanus]XP_055356840.1 uncharacterized protein LOC129601912 isoform X2 [Paramacrobiotus metropolitanus]